MMKIVKNNTIISIESNNPTSITNDNKPKEFGFLKAVECDGAWISTDYHIGKELLGKDQDHYMEDTESVIELHNKKVKKDDIFLFLGDLTESEFGNEHNIAALNYVKKKVQKLNGIKIMFAGNNDTCSDYFYKQCGFREVIRRAYLIGDKCTFSHFPVNVSGDKINIHGHIHGSKKYWGIDAKNKIDAYWKLWNGPVKLSFLLDKLKNGEYKGEVISGDNNTPEGHDHAM